MTHPPSGPNTPAPPPGPRDDALDPNSAEGRAVAARLTRTLAHIELEIAEREAVKAA